MPPSRRFRQALLRNVYSRLRCALQVVGVRDELVTACPLHNRAEKPDGSGPGWCGCDPHGAAPKAILALRFLRLALGPLVTERSATKTVQCTGYTLPAVL